MKKLAFFVPVNDAEQVKDAMFNAGAGKIGDYDRCCFEYEGWGQFRPLAGATPHIGSHGSVEKVRELKIEMVCADDCVKASIQAMLDAHPYEEVAFEVFEMLDWKSL